MTKISGNVIIEVMKINFLSDLHLEHSNMDLPPLDGDCIVLAGDICVDFKGIKTLLAYKLPDDRPIIFVPGNHEFEGKRFSKAMDELFSIEEDFPNFKMLYNKTFSHNGVKFIGTTLWSNFEGQGINNKEEVKKQAKFNVVDFSYIFKNNEEGKKPHYIAWTPDDMEKEFQKAYDFLEYELKNNPTQEEKVVVTHFAPHKNSISKDFKHDILTAYWVNHLEELMGFSKCWIHGHTHRSFDYEVSGTRVMCNPRGYSKTYDLTSNHVFDKTKSIEIKPSIELVSTEQALKSKINP